MTTQPFLPVSVPFHQDELLSVEVNHEVFVPVKPICEKLGIAWQPQSRKITAEQRYHHMNIPLLTSGGVQDMTCLPLNKINGWLFSINPAKVKPEFKQRLIDYQEECFQVLFDYWQGKRDPRPDFDRWLDTLQQTVAATVAATLNAMSATPFTPPPPQPPPAAAPLNIPRRPAGYREAQRVQLAGDFFQQRCLLAADGFTPSMQLYEAYRHFCHAQDDVPLSQYRFSQALFELCPKCVREVRRVSGWLYRGIAGIALKEGSYDNTSN